MSGEEVFLFVVSFVLAGVGMGVTWTGQLHRLYFRDNPAPGIVRAGVILAMAWIGFVLAFFADPSVRGIYVVFYLVMGFAVVKVFGQTFSMAYGARTRVDAGERRNVPVAIVIAAFTLATGMIFGGSLWGEADPVGDDEGGWWIPLAFFLLGWLSLLIAFALFLRREKGSLTHRLRSERDLADARAATTFLLGSAVALTDAVSGDFWGWYHGLLTFGVLATMLIVHEAFATWSGAEERTREVRGNDPKRVLESAAYLGIALLIWVANRFLDLMLGPG
jgi:hypothetical protein